MRTSSLLGAAILAAVMSLGGYAQAQGPMAPYGVMYPGMMPPNPYMMGAGYGGPMMAGAMAPMPTQGPACAAGPSCAAGPGCTDAAGPGCCDDCPGWCHHISVFGEFLYLRARNAEIAYAVPIDGNLVPGGQQFQIGGVRVVDPDFAPGFRFGAGFTLGECSQIVMTYSQLDSTTQDAISLAGVGPVLRSLVGPVPPALNAAQDSLDARAALATQFKLFDVDYKGLFAYNCDYRLAYVVGARYANLEQHFTATYVTNGFNNVRAESEFDGAGLKLGLEGERYSDRTNFFVYGKGAASFVGGQFRTRYEFNNQSDPLIVDTNWKAGRLVTILDLEVGLGWRNECDNLRLSLGYLYSSWFNTVKTNEWINTVQQNNFVDPSDNYRGMMTFDGVTAKVEVLW
jgi:hypothetical protein